MTTTFDPTAAEHHADRCHGLPIFEQDGVGQYTARCAQGDFEVTGCETRREAGARFYGGEQPGLYGAMGAGLPVADLVDRLVAEARRLDKEISELRNPRGDHGPTRMELQVLAGLETQYRLLDRYVNPDTGEMR
jgi:hypothetical protein